MVKATLAPARFTLFLKPSEGYKGGLSP